MKNTRNPFLPFGLSFKKCFLILLILLLGWWLFSYIQKPEEGEALRQALDKINEKSYRASLPLLSVAGTNNNLKYWAKVWEAKAREHLEQPHRALKLYENIPDSEAPSLDARLGILRIKFRNENSSSTETSIGAQLSKLERDIHRARRKDLLPELMLLKVKAAVAEDAFSLAQELSSSLRKKYPKSEAAREARSTQTEILTRMAAAGIKHSAAAEIAEAKLILQEEDPLAALEQVQHTKRSAGENSYPFFEAMLLEEQILRKLGRNEEADRTLAIISADADEGIADEALLRMTRNAWNTNEHDRALEFVAHFLRRFPKSPLRDTVLYLKARILEEVPQPVEARDVYRRLSKETNNVLLKVRALRQIAWLYLIGGDTIYAAKGFKKAADTAKKGLEENSKLDATSLAKPTLSPAESRDLHDELSHALYWYAATVEELDTKSRDLLSPKPDQMEELWREVTQANPLGFYGLFAAKKLQNEIPSLSDSEKQASAAKACSLPIPQTLQSRLTVLHHARLPQLSKAEIDWFLSRRKQRDSSDSSEEKLTRAQLLAKYSSLAKSVGYVESLLNKQSVSLNDISQDPCKKVLFNLGFPIPYFEIFTQQAAKNKLSLALLAAVSRTESHFNKDAVSSKDAMGLLQLLESTAKSEGLEEGQNLFDPQINIALGAQHLARLLAKYQGEKIYAIAAYNAGSTAVERWQQREKGLSPMKWIERIGYPETKRYVKKILRAELLYQLRTNTPRSQ